MGLVTYRNKRKFGATPEPQGKKATGSSGPLRFVIQKHAAKRLHYDFRLELDGMLKSWAIPKGPSMNPQDKRLAMMVEDHPLDYRTFEGTIPEGNYGAGTVMVWDQGVYSSRETADPIKSGRLLLAGLKKGHLTFVLNGSKLKGEFGLVKIRSQKAGENSWLLVKADDEFAEKTDIPLSDRSAKTGRTLGEIESQAGKEGEVWISDRAQSSDSKEEPVDISGLPKEALPKNLRPMLASTTDKVRDEEGWLFEIKWDGYRALAETGPGGRIYSRNLNSFDRQFPKIREAVRQLPFRALLDGEIVVLGKDGRPDFQKLQNYGEAPDAGGLVYFVFDILHLNGRNLRRLPLKARKDILRRSLHKQGPIRYSDHAIGRGEEFFRLAKKKGLEGVMAKDGNSEYIPGKRSGSWLKIKTRNSQEVVITGFTAPRGSREKFGSLVLGVYRDGRLKFAGHTGSGFDEAGLKTLHAKLRNLVQKKSPFDPVPKTNMPVTWVRPVLVAEVDFAEWTADGRLRQAIYKGLRPDKEPEEAKPESNPGPKDFPGGAEGQKLLVNRREVILTNLSKIYWPKDKYTKADLINYYRAVSRLILPYLKDRPETLHRYPNGISGKSFYQKDMGRIPPPDWVKTATVDHKGERLDYLIVQDEASLLYAANLGCIEIHPFNSRIQTLDFPDYLAIDLDPEAISFDRVRETALMVHELLEELNVPNFCKTSGASGLHIYIPLGARYTYDQAKQFGKILATVGNRRLPSVTSVERSPSKRQGRVYLDYLQNNRGQTLASAYSLRPLPGAPVSTPLEWREVSRRFSPSDFDISSAVARFRRTGDLFKPVLGKGIDLVKALRKLESVI